MAPLQETKRVRDRFCNVRFCKHEYSVEHGFVEEGKNFRPKVFSSDNQYPVSLCSLFFRNTF